MNQEYLVNVCRESLIQGNHEQQQYLDHFFVDIFNYSLIDKIIPNVYVSFMFCLTLKKHLKHDANTHGMTFNVIKGIDLQKMTIERDEIKNVKLTHLYHKLIRVKTNDCKEKKNKKMGSIYSENSNKMNFNHYQKFEQFQSEKYTLQWHRSILFLSLLITSIKSEKSKIPNQIDVNWLKGLKKLRYEVIARLSITIFSELTNKQSKYIFKTILDELQSNEDELQTIAGYACILKEIIQQLAHTDLIEAKSINNAYGRWFREYLCEGLQVLLQRYSEEISIIKRYFEAINSYLELICKIHQHFINALDCLIDSQQDNQDFIKLCQPKINFDPYIKMFNQSICLFISQYTQNLTLEKTESLASVLQIMQKLTYHASYDDLFDYTSTNVEELNYQKILVKIMQVIMIEWMNYQQKYQKNHLHHKHNNIQLVFFDIFQNVLAFDDTVLKSNGQFWQLILTQFCRDMLKKTSFKLQEGSKSHIAKMFRFLTQILQLKIIVISESFMLQKMKEIIMLFIKKCEHTDEIQETFMDYKEKKETYQEYFLEPLHFIQKVYEYQNQQESMELITYLKSILFESCQYRSNKGRFSIVLSIQMIRNIQINSQQIMAHQKCHLFLYLMQQFKQHFSFEYLMLIDAVLQQLIKEQTYSFSSSYLWYYLNNNLCSTFEQFINHLMMKLISCLSNATSTQITNYSLDLIIDLSTKIKTIVDNLRKNTLNNYKEMQLCLHPVFNLIKDINIGLLEHIDNYHQRSKIFQLYGLLNIKDMEDLYGIYEIMQQNLKKQETGYYIFFWIDVYGLLSVDFNEETEEVLFQLIFNDFSQKKDIIQCFSMEAFDENEIFFKIFVDLLKCLIKKLIKIEKIEVKKELQYRFALLFEQKLNILSEAYNNENYEAIHEIYALLMQIGFLHYYPKIPEVIYCTQSSKKIINWLYKNIPILYSQEQLKKLFNNVFLRKQIRFQHNIDQNLKEQLINKAEHPLYLNNLMQYFQDISQRPFFNYQALISEIISYLYEIYCGKDDLAMTMDPFDLDQYSDDDQTYNKKMFIEKFFHQSSYKKKINILIKIMYYFQERNSEEYQFIDYEAIFIREQKKILEKA